MKVNHLKLKVIAMVKFVTLVNINRRIESADITANLGVELSQRESVETADELRRFCSECVGQYANISNPLTTLKIYV